MTDDEQESPDPLYLVVRSCSDTSGLDLFSASVDADPGLEPTRGPGSDSSTVSAKAVAGMVAVVEQSEVPHPVRFMTYGKAVIGAQYIEPELQGASRPVRH